MGKVVAARLYELILEDDHAGASKERYVKEDKGEPAAII